MDIDPIYTHALFVRPPVVLGRPLRPFTAGHWCALSALGSPYVVYSRTPNAADLIIAVWVCSQPDFKTLRELLGVDPGGRPGMGAKVVILIESFAGEVVASGQRTSATEQLRFQSYLNAYFLKSQHWEYGHTTDWKLRVPTFWAIAAGLVVAGKGSITLDQAWDMPLCEAFALINAVGNLEGQNTIITEEEQIAREEVRKTPPRPRNPQTPKRKRTRGKRKKVRRHGKG